jgi:hypothetical protein
MVFWQPAPGYEARKHGVVRLQRMGEAAAGTAGGDMSSPTDFLDVTHASFTALATA